MVSEDWQMPASIRDLLLSRLVGAGETGRQLLDAAAVIGRSFDFDTLQEASGRGEEETVSALEGLIRQGLVNEVRGGEGPGRLVYDFSHEQLRTLVYQETGGVFFIAGSPTRWSLAPGDGANPGPWPER